MLRLLAIAGIILTFAGVVMAQEARLITSVRPVTVRPISVTPLEPNDIEKRAFEQTTLARVQNNLPPLTWDADVCR